MDRLVNAIITKLKTGSIPTVVLFSDQDQFPDPPYVVVKPEAGVIEKTRSYRIIAHHIQGNFDVLEDYVLVELDTLLLGGIDDKEGSRYKLYASDFTDITPEPNDNSYFMERLYYCPMTIRNS
jgi:hypothetical protein